MKTLTLIAIAFFYSVVSFGQASATIGSTTSSSTTVNNTKIRQSGKASLSGSEALSTQSGENKTSLSNEATAVSSAAMADKPMVISSQVLAGSSSRANISESALTAAEPAIRVDTRDAVISAKPSEATTTVNAKTSSSAKINHHAAINTGLENGSSTSVRARVSLGTPKINTGKIKPVSIRSKTTSMTNVKL